jgi:DNA invertase Pin-like site-specific DNA recombinase
VSLRELEDVELGFASLTEVLDLTTLAGRAVASLLAVFASSAFCGEPQNAEFEREILRERVRVCLAHARQNGQPLGRLVTAALTAASWPVLSCTNRTP